MITIYNGFIPQMCGMQVCKTDIEDILSTLSGSNYFYWSLLVTENGNVIRNLSVFASSQSVASKTWNTMHLITLMYNSLMFVSNLTPPQGHINCWWTYSSKLCSHLNCMALWSVDWRAGGFGALAPTPLLKSIMDMVFVNRGVDPFFGLGGGGGKS